MHILLSHHINLWPDLLHPGVWACCFADRKYWSETRALWGKEGANPGKQTKTKQTLFTGKEVANEAWGKGEEAETETVKIPLRKTGSGLLYRKKEEQVKIHNAQDHFPMWPRTGRREGHWRGVCTKKHRLGEKFLCMHFRGKGERKQVAIGFSSRK